MPSTPAPPGDVEGASPAAAAGEAAASRPEDAPVPRGAGGLAFELRMALRYLTTRRREGPVAVVTLLCAGGVLVGVFALVLALALMTGLHGDIRQRLLASNPHVVITPAWGRTSFTLSEAARVARLAETDAHVVATAPYATAWGLLRSRLVPAGLPVQLKAVDPDLEDRATGLASRTTGMAWARLVEDARRAPSARPQRTPGEEESIDDGDEEPLAATDLAPPEPPAVLLGAGLATELGVTPGDVVRLVEAQAELSATGPMAKSRALRVVGLLDTGLHEYDATWAVTSLSRLRPGAEPTVDGVQVALRDPLDAARVAGTLADALGPACSVADWTTTFSRLFAAFRWEKLIMMFALGLIGLVAGFNMLTILTMNVMARVPDIGILSALGAPTRSITRIFVWMGLGLGGAGTALGLLLGTVTALLLDRYRLIALDPSVYLVTHVPFRVEPANLAAVAVGMLSVSLLATLVPARAAARLDPLVALRSA